jgi:hypothetical protein
LDLQCNQYELSDFLDVSQLKKNAEGDIKNILQRKWERQKSFTEQSLKFDTKFNHILIKKTLNCLFYGKEGKGKKSFIYSLVFYLSILSYFIRKDLEIHHNLSSIKVCKTREAI